MERFAIGSQVHTQPLGAPLAVANGGTPQLVTEPERLLPVDIGIKIGEPWCAIGLGFDCSRHGPRFTGLLIGLEMPRCNGSTNQLLLKSDFDPIQCLQTPLGGCKTAGLHEPWDRGQPLRKGQLLTVNEVFKKRNVQALHLQKLGRKHRPVEGLFAGQHKAAAQLLEFEAMGHGAAQGRRIQHLPLNREIQTRRPGHQASRLAVEAHQSLLQRRSQTYRLHQLLVKAIAQLLDEIGQPLRAAQANRQAGG